tara:strand:- start:469 stop:642 length:174 start_codon:yes stop_codon:yes gene_type:complete
MPWHFTPVINKINKVKNSFMKKALKCVDSCIIYKFTVPLNKKNNEKCNYFRGQKEVD